MYFLLLFCYVTAWRNVWAQNGEAQAPFSCCALLLSSLELPPIPLRVSGDMPKLKDKALGVFTRGFDQTITVTHGHMLQRTMNGPLKIQVLEPGILSESWQLCSLCSFSSTSLILASANSVLCKRFFRVSFWTLQVLQGGGPVETNDNQPSTGKSYGEGACIYLLTHLPHAT